MHYFRGHPYIPPNQEGQGLGSILSSIARTAIPFLKTGARFVGREALRAGCDVGDDVLSGQTVKQSIRKRVFGEEPQEGSGVGIKRRRITNQSKAKRSKPRRKTNHQVVRKKTQKRRSPKNKKGKTHDIFS